MATTTGCADTDGDGEGEFEWTGSENPQNTSYRNPVWEPSLAGGSCVQSRIELCGHLFGDAVGCRC